MQENIVRAVDAEFRLDKLEPMARHIAAIERTFCYRRFAESARYCLEQLRALGLSDVRLFELAADGRMTYMDFVMPQAWDVRSAELEIVEPRDAAEPLIDYRRNPLCVANRCAPTPAEGIVAEVITLEQLRALGEAPGRLVYTDGQHPGPLRAEVAAKGAAGLISDTSPARDFAPQETYWINGWCSPGWYQTAEHRPLLCFSLSPEVGRRLKAQLDRGSVRVWAKVDADLYDGSIYTVTGLLPGKRPQEIVLLAHIYEPFIADDAVGAAAAIEIVRTLQQLIAHGDLPQPELGVRVLIGMERYGFAHYFAQEDARRRAALAINMDCLCLSPARTRQPVEVRYSPASLPFWGDLLVWEMARHLLGGYPLAVRRGNLSDDTFVSDVTVGVPSQWVWTQVGATHHTSLWFQEEMNDWELGAKIAKLVASYVAAMACAGPNDQARFGEMLVSGQAEELRAQRDAWVEALGRGEIDDQALRARARFLVRWQKERVRSWAKMYPDVDPSPLLQALAVRQEELVGPLLRGSLPSAERDLGPAAEQARGLVPKRKTLGMPFSQARIPLSERVSAQYEQALNWVDGHRDLLEIAELVACETEKAPDGEWLAQFVDYCRLMARYGYLGLIERSTSRQ
ncbi:MAG: hypothetical protein H5T69_09300 [Chloroflexi bacterium]|nr:hypothetical protein [Chloroflexota bacterium]